MILFLGFLFTFFWALIELAKLGHNGPLKVFVACFVCQFVWHFSGPFIDFIFSSRMRENGSEPLQSNGMPPLEWEASREKEEQK